MSSALIIERSAQRFDRERWLALWRNLLGTRLNAAITLGLVAFVIWAFPPLWRWAVVDAIWNGNASECAGSSGACWGFIGEKFRFILFGFYPPPLQGRALAALLLMFGLVIIAAMPRFWGRTLGVVWIGGLAATILLMVGWPFGEPTPTDKWGGLPVTMLLSIGAFVGAFPLAILLALARRSSMGGLRLLAIAFIEVLRGVPFIAVLYAATLLFPLMLPSGSAIDKFLRAEVALILFVAAYLAEIVRAGLQAVPNGQYEAARSLGLSYWRTMRLVILPQALRVVIPAIVNLAIGIFQDTTLVIIIGMFDFLNTARVAATDPNWLGFYNEAYMFVALVYFFLCFCASKYSLWLEARLRQVRKQG
ncbi:amino acid ABC transporter permease [Terrarubrum flagellatum]|uniref:amino acid ABC transporter permease n=1 Tax=Terrirubrum flagellatum TaxID=2895980 RepID=UPI0031455A78